MVHFLKSMVLISGSYCNISKLEIRLSYEENFSIKYLFHALSLIVAVIVIWWKKFEILFLNWLLTHIWPCPAQNCVVLISVQSNRFIHLCHKIEQKSSVKKCRILKSATNSRTKREVGRRPFARTMRHTNILTPLELSRPSHRHTSHVRSFYRARRMQCCHIYSIIL